MPGPSKHCSVRLDRQQHERIVALAIAQQCSPSDVIRSAVETYLGTAAILTVSNRRMARISEFLQLALDVIISEQYPEFRDRIIAHTDKRLEQHHGA